jgi:hypothetical protein
MNGPPMIHIGTIALIGFSSLVTVATEDKVEIGTTTVWKTDTSRRKIPQVSDYGNMLTCEIV